MHSDIVAAKKKKVSGVQLTSFDQVRPPPPSLEATPPSPV